MKGFTIVFSAVAISTAAFVLSGCSGATQSSSVGLPLTGAAPQSLGLSGRGHRHARPAFLPDGKVLYVADEGHNAVEVLKYQNHAYANLGAITDGIHTPYDSWVDKLGNLYVSNFDGGDVTEYDTSGNLIFTYSSGLSNPAGVTTDKFGNVYVTNVGTSIGTINEYPQGFNSAFTCSLGDDFSYGTAVDEHGDVFVTSFFTGQIFEYPRGLFKSGCKSTALPFTVAAPLGIAIDRQGDLVVCQRAASSPAVDIIAPPYTGVTATFGSGWSEPTFVTIDRGGTQANVADGFSVVKIMSYPNPTSVTTLGSGFGISAPESAVASNNYVP